MPKANAVGGFKVSGKLLPELSNFSLFWHRVVMLGQVHFDLRPHDLNICGRSDWSVDNVGLSAMWPTPADCDFVVRVATLDFHYARASIARLHASSTDRPVATICTPAGIPVLKTM